MLNISVAKQPPDVEFKLTGELDMVSSDVLQEAINKLNMAELKSLTLSLSGLDFIDSTGIGQLISYHRSLKTKGVRFLVNNSNGEIEEVLQLIGLREIIDS